MLKNAHGSLDYETHVSYSVTVQVADLVPHWFEAAVDGLAGEWADTPEDEDRLLWGE